MRSPKKEKKAEPAQLKDELKAKLEALNQHYAIVQRGSHVHVMYEGFNVDGHREITYLSLKDFYLKQAHNKVWDAENNKHVQVAPLWASWESRREYEGLYFYPGKKESPRYYNLWRGFNYTPNNNGECNLLLNHIKDNICSGNEEIYKWVMAWLADIFQNPEHKPGTALVLRGEMGIGKGAFANHIGKLLGQHYLTVANQSQVTGRFNSHLAEKIMMFVDESFWSGEKIGAGALRALITEPKQSSEMKGRDIILIDSYLRLIIAANDEWAVPVGMKDERRFMVIDAGNAQQRNHEYFKKIEEQLENGGYGALLKYLLEYKYDPSLPRKIIQTDALLDQKLHSMKPEMKWVMSFLMDGEIGMVKFDREENIANWPESPAAFILTSDFYSHYSKWCDEMNIKNKTSSVGLPRSLRKIINLKKVRKDAGYAYQLETLEAYREQFEKAVGNKLVWEEGENDNA